jgi:pimeloyl-ACP methyl ester carboxylesterase
MPSEGHYASVNGLRMYYEVHGEGNPLLLLHGGATSIETFTHQIPFFAREFQVIAPEQMGHGRTADIPERDFHYHDMAEDTVELMNHLGIADAFIVGWSDGGILGLDIAIHHPERVRKLACSGAVSRVDGLEPESLDWLGNATPADWPKSFREAYERLSPDGPSHWPLVIARIVKMFRSEPSFTSEQIASIKAPTLLIVGDHDMVRPEHAVEMFRLIPGAELSVVPHAGHSVPMEKPALWNETVRSFLKQPVAVNPPGTPRAARAEEARRRDA